MVINLSVLLEKQAALDALINEEHSVTHASTKEERFLALFVELAELANATRVFKYWSLKGSDAREVVLDEYADGLHFFLSLALVYNIKLDLYEGEEEGKRSKKDIVVLFNDLFTLLADFRDSGDQETFFEGLHSFFRLGSALGFSSEDITTAYNTKLVVNYERQNAKY